MPTAYVRPACVALALAVFAADVLTPQLFVVAILLNGSIALSSLAFDPRFTRLLVAGALVANIVAGYTNGLADGGHWNAIALGDRTIAAFSFLLVGGLTIASQRTAKAAGELAAREARAQRERGVRRAVETIRASMNAELIERAIVREAPSALAIDAAFGFFGDAGLSTPLTLRASAAREGVDEQRERPSPQIVSLSQRLAESRSGTAIERGDPLGRFLLDELGVEHAYAVPIVEHETVFGMLLLARRVPFDPNFEDGLRAFVDQAAVALAQAALFVQLAERNEELAGAVAALRERGEIIRDIVYALSHDLRTPLAAARMTMLQALDGAYGALPEAYREILRRTLASNDELAALAETLLLVSRYESGEASIRREPIDLAQLAANVARELEPLSWEKKLAVRVLGPRGDDPAPSGAAVALGDPGELRRAVGNLLANAVTATPRGGRIDLRVSEGGGVVRLAVEDTGHGVAPADRPKLFERFGNHARGAGTGLGLYIVRRIVENAGGRTGYEPRESGGSRFFFELPAAVTEKAAS